MWEGGDWGGRARACGGGSGRVEEWGFLPLGARSKKPLPPPIHTAAPIIRPPLTHAPLPQPPPPGAKPERVVWEIPFYFTLAGVALVCWAAATSKKPTPHAWARDEVEERERR